MLIPLKTLLTKYNLNPSGILHIGASTGQEAKDYKDCSIDTVVWIEAIPYVFEQLKQNLQIYPRMVALNHCISDEDNKIVRFNISNNEAQSSSMLELGTHKTAHPEVKYVSHVDLVTKRMDTVLKEYDLDLNRFDFLNIDLQGAELMALKSFGEQLSKVNYIYCEVNKEELYVGCPLVKDIQDYLWLYNFEMVEIEWCGNFGWGDAFFIKKELL